jgi:hypothetical protein
MMGGQSWLLSWDRIGVLVFLVQEESEKNFGFRSLTFLSSCCDGGTAAAAAASELNKYPVS